MEHELPDQLEACSVGADSELNFSASAFVPSAQPLQQPANPDNTELIPASGTWCDPTDAAATCAEVADTNMALWCDANDAPDTNELHSELYFAAADCQELERALAQKKQDCDRIEAEQAAHKAVLEAGGCNAEDAEQTKANAEDKQTKFQVRKLKTSLRAAEVEIEKLDLIIIQGEDTVKKGDLQPHWLVIGSEWDLEQGGWKTQCGHMCVPGDSWSQSIPKCRQELVEAVESVKQLQESLLGNTHKARLKKSQQSLAGLKATLKVLRREKSELEQSFSQSQKKVSRLTTRIRENSHKWNTQSLVN